MVREITGDLLRELGHEVIEVADATSALEYLRHGDEPIDLLLTDVRMPNMTGYALARKAIEQRPSLHVVYMTGQEEGVSAPGHVLRKPCTLGRLESVLTHIERLQSAA
ncbi:response regulator [Novosphingobium sp. NBM11]|nr:response regulator [Novosphingobium sp. NBM11]